MPKPSALMTFLKSMAQTLPLVESGTSIGFKGVPTTFNLQHGTISSALLLPHGIRTVLPASLQGKKRTNLINTYNATLTSAASALQSNNWSVNASGATVTLPKSAQSTGAALVSSGIKASDSGLRFFAYPDGLKVVQLEEAEANNLDKFVKTFQVFHDELKQQPEMSTFFTDRSFFISAPRATDKKDEPRATDADESDRITRNIYPL